MPEATSMTAGSIAGLAAFIAGAVCLFVLMLVSIGLGKADVETRYYAQVIIDAFAICLASFWLIPIAVRLFRAITGEVPHD